MLNKLRVSVMISLTKSETEENIAGRKVGSNFIFVKSLVTSFFSGKLVLLICRETGKGLRPLIEKNLPLFDPYYSYRSSFEALACLNKVN